MMRAVDSAGQPFQLYDREESSMCDELRRYGVALKKLRALRATVDLIQLEPGVRSVTAAWGTIGVFGR
jgi:hypothetical protein